MGSSKNSNFPDLRVDRTKNIYVYLHIHVFLKLSYSKVDFLNFGVKFHEFQHVWICDHNQDTGEFHHSPKTPLSCSFIEGFEQEWPAQSYIPERPLMLVGRG